ncbi:MAG: SRPBCC domain-containing protein [Saprospiraceae bacterium]|nr:SRPBCC domain-containing protein [Saprospiraceae bacterium]
MTTNPTPAKVPTPLKKRLLYILAGVLLIVLLAGILLPKKIQTSVTREIKVPRNYVFNLLNNQRNIPFWNSWAMEDKEMVLSYGKSISGEGSSYSWTSPKSGNGTITYTKIVPNELVEASLDMEGQQSKYVITLSENNGKTAVTWAFESHMPFPKNIAGPILKYIVNKHNKKSISAMEEEVKRRQKGEYYGFKLNEVTQNQKFFVTSRNNVSFDQITQYYSQNLAAVYQKLQQENITSAGPPCILFYSYDEPRQNTDMAVAVPVITPISLSQLSTETLPGQNAVVIDYYGDYAKTAPAHYAMEDYLNDHNYLRSAPVVEEYVTDPLKEKDMNKWLTRIYYYTTEKK